MRTLGSFGKWAVRRDKIARTPVEALTRPRRKARLPRVSRWDTLERLLEQCTDRREKSLLALMCYGGLRRSEIVALDVGDVALGFGLRRVQSKGGTSSPLVFTERADISALAVERGLPAVSMFVEFAEAGGLMAYAPSLREAFWRAGAYPGRILQGAKPGELPVERPTKFELLVNLKTAKALGLTIPQSVLGRADQVIE